MSIHLKKDLIVKLALIHKHGIITVLPLSKHAIPIFAQRKPNGQLRLLVDLRKINAPIADDYTKNNHPVIILSDAADHLAVKSLFCKLDCSQAYHCLRCWTNGQWKWLLSFLLAELLPRGDLHKALADLCLPSQASCASNWTQLSMLMNVLNTCMILEFQPKMLRT